ncbi:gas vesicle protein [Sphaerisporangium rhizosphaerae]|uniref:Gas vesicle protein n=1 Tax=Sphaerisporangium rhizosphaerae TaxID=2269375 RepID=A0ABW2PKD3_9ACTN
MSEPMSSGRVMSPYGGPQRAPARDSGGNLGDILERVLDRGVVIVGDIRVNLLDIELLTIKLRLLIASVDTARELGIDWWEHDPWLSSGDRDLVEENRRLRRRLAAAEGEPLPAESGRSGRERERLAAGDRIALEDDRALGDDRWEEPEPRRTARPGRRRAPGAARGPRPDVPSEEEHGG